MDKMNVVWNILKRGGAWNASEIGEELGLPKIIIHRVIHGLRNRFTKNDSKINRWIYTTATGYSLAETPENAMYEARQRLSHGTSTILNGGYVFKQGKKIAAKQHKQLKIEFRPAVLQIEKM